MSSRWLRIFVCLYMSLWLGVVVPGHRRGQVKLTGQSASADQSSCGPSCPFCDAGGRGNPASHHRRSSDPCEDCAVCNFAARLELPTVINLTLPFVGLLHIVPIRPVLTQPGTEFVPDCRGRGPPTIA